MCWACAEDSARRRRALQRASTVWTEPEGADEALGLIDLDGLGSAVDAALTGLQPLAAAH